MGFKKIIFEIKDYLRRGSTASRRAALQYERMPRDRKAERDWRDRVDIVNFAYKNIKFYKDFYDAVGFAPSSLKSREDWDMVPAVEKSMIRESGDSFILPGVPPRRLVVSTTGGSTGRPLKFYKDSNVHFEAIHWRALGWYGCLPSDNVGIVNRRVPHGAMQLLKNRLLWWPTARCYLDASAVDSVSMRKFLEDIKRQKTVYLTGYCGSLEHIADFIIANDIRLSSLKLVWSTTSPLLPNVRKRMEQAFGCPIMDQYGCCELPNIAVQRPGERFLTVNSDYVHVDIVGGDGKVLPVGEYGDILITDLQTRVFPLIKYRLGDRSFLFRDFLDSEDGFPRLAPVQGRITDTVYFPDNGFIDGAYLTTICDAYSDVVDSYQIYQDKEYNIFFRVVLRSGKSTDDPVLGIICAELEKKIAGRVPLSLEVCDAIPDDRGKRRYVISEVALTRQP